MHIGVNALILKPGEHSGVHVAVRGAIQACVAGAASADRFTLYVQRRAPTGLPPPDARVCHVRPFWPVGWRAGRITWEQFRLHSRVFTDALDLLFCPAYVMPHWCLKPAVVAVHDAFALRNPEFCTAANRTHYQRMLPRSLVRARAVVVPSAWVRDELLAHAAEAPGENGPSAEALAGKIRVIPWGVDGCFRPVTDARLLEEVALRHGLPPHFVLCVGRIEPKKNVQRAIEGYFAAAMAKSLPHRLVIVGPRGWGVEKKTRRFIQSLGLENRTVLPGFVPDEDMPALYSMASCLVFPSLAEGFGLPVLEAMACGTPVVCADIPPLAALVGDAAVTVRADDLPGVRVALEEVLTRPDFAAALRHKGLARAQAFGWGETGRRLLALFQEVILEDRSARG